MQYCRKHRLRRICPRIPSNLDRRLLDSGVPVWASMTIRTLLQRKAVGGEEEEEEEEERG